MKNTEKEISNHKLQLPIYSFLYRGETFLYYQEGYIDIKRNEEMFNATIYNKFMKV